MSHLVSEVLGQLLLGGERVLHHVVQQAGDDPTRWRQYISVAPPSEGRDEIYARIDQWNQKLKEDDEA